MTDFKTHSTPLPGQDLTFLGSTPYVYHCHHFNLFHDQTVDDALGEEQGFQLKARAARDAVHPLLADLAATAGAVTPTERLELASSLFSWMGQGRLAVIGGPDGGEARGAYLHYSFAWREKYGAQVRRLFPADPFGAGFAAAASEVAFSLPPGSFEAGETACFAMREPGCSFALRRAAAAAAPPVLDRGGIEKGVTPPAAGLDEERIAGIAAGLKDFVLGIGADERGLVNGFGVFITRHLSTYYNQTAFDTIHRMESGNPGAAAVAEELFGESGHVCVFYTLGNILLSPEWEALVGAPRNQVEEVVSSCFAITRGLGFGHWVPVELIAGRRLVARCSSNYEAPFYRERYGPATKPRCYFFANAVRAIMQLAHRVDWQARPELTGELYQSLFKADLRWHMEETLCRARGDECCEVVVTRA